jgi:hypothetical protein
LPGLSIHCFAISIDGYGAGPSQDLENPLGVGGMALHEWAFATRTFRLMFDAEVGSTGFDDGFAARGFHRTRVDARGPGAAARRRALT